MLCLLFGLAVVQVPAVPRCAHGNGLGLIKILAEQPSHVFMWGPTETTSHNSARDLCAQHLGALPIITDANRDCVFSSGHHGSKIRLPVRVPGVLDAVYGEDSCMYMYNDKKTYPADCGETAFMLGQDDYIVCEVPLDSISKSWPVVDSCAGDYDTCGVCNGPARSCLECTDGCLSAPSPDAEASSGQSSQNSFQSSSGGFIATMAILGVFLVVALAFVMSWSKEKRRRNSRVPKPDNEVVSFENPHYTPDSEKNDNDGSPTYQYDEIAGRIPAAGQTDTSGYLVPAPVAIDNDDSGLYDCTPGDHNQEEDQDEPYYSQAVGSETAEDEPFDMEKVMEKYSVPSKEHKGKNEPDYDDAYEI